MCKKTAIQPIPYVTEYPFRVEDMAFGILSNEPGVTFSAEKVAEVANECLQLFGYNEYRDGQKETIISFVTSRDVLVHISGTGSGKVRFISLLGPLFGIQMKLSLTMFVVLFGHVDIYRTTLSACLLEGYAVD